MLERGEYVTDKMIEQKLYALYLKNFTENVIRNDEYDLVPHHKFSSPVLSLMDSRAGRNLQSTDNPSTTINTLVEKYPKDFCYNNGQLADQTQTYYLCR